jgi:hypothetical protein
MRVSLAKALFREPVTTFLFLFSSFSLLFLLGNAARSQFLPRGKNSDLPSAIAPSGWGISKKGAKTDHF